MDVEWIYRMTCSNRRLQVITATVVWHHFVHREKIRSTTTSDVMNYVVNATCMTYPAFGDNDDSGGNHQFDITSTTVASSPISELSPVEVSQIVCFWIIFSIGVVGNLLVLILIVWKRSSKQVGFVLFISFSFYFYSRKRLLPDSAVDPVHYTEPMSLVSREPIRSR